MTGKQEGTELLLVCRPTVLNPALPNWAKRGHLNMALSNFPDSNNKGPSFSQADCRYMLALIVR